MNTSTNNANLLNAEDIDPRSAADLKCMEEMEIYYESADVKDQMTLVEFCQKYFPMDYAVHLALEEAEDIYLQAQADQFEKEYEDSLIACANGDLDNEGEWELSMPPESYNPGEYAARSLNIRPSYYREKEEYIVCVGIYYRGRASTYRKAKKLAYRNMRELRYCSACDLPF